MDASPDLSLFPPTEARRTGMLPVDELHTLYREESGNPEGISVVYVHGGPGGGSSPEKRRWFDQHAAYRSTPVSEIRGNTTQLLVKDMETPRRMLGIEK